MTTDHRIPGLPDNWAVRERRTSSAVRFIPRLNGRTLQRANGGVAWFTTLEAAQQAAVDLAGRMQS